MSPEKRILLMRLNGLTPESVAAELDVSAKTVRRVVADRSAGPRREEIRRYISERIEPVAVEGFWDQAA